jgi:hypothetical protein
MEAVKPGSDVSLAKNTAVFWGFQSTNDEIDQRFRRVTSLSFIILDEDGTDVSARFPVVGAPLGGIPIGSTITDPDDLIAAEIYRGVYAAEFSIPPTYDPGGGAVVQVPGRYFVEWTFTSEDSEVGTQQTTFRLIDPAFPIVKSYAQIQDAVDEGITIDDTLTPASGTYTSARVKNKLEAATRQVARFTGRYFGIKTEKRLIKTAGRDYVHLGTAVIGLATITEKPPTPVDELLLFSVSEAEDISYWIPSRHIRHGMDDPDDRRRPILKKAICFEFIDDCLGNLVIEGVWGWTDCDDRTVWGRVPSEIVGVTVQIAIANIAPAADIIASAANAATGSVKSIQTFDQKVTYDTTQANLATAVDRAQGQLSVADVLNFYRERYIISGMG